MPVQEKFKAAVAQTSPCFIDCVSINLPEGLNGRGYIVVNANAEIDFMVKAAFT
jgi:hypothetical protein